MLEVIDILNQKSIDTRFIVQTYGENCPQSAGAPNETLSINLIAKT